MKAYEGMIYSSPHFTRTPTSPNAAPPSYRPQEFKLDLLEVKETFPPKKGKVMWRELSRKIGHKIITTLLIWLQPPKTAFDDYMDYRMNRVHRGAMVRSILNQVELDPKPTRYRPLPITSIK